MQPALFCHSFILHTKHSHKAHETLSYYTFSCNLFCLLFVQSSRMFAALCMVAAVAAVYEKRQQRSYVHKLRLCGAAVAAVVQRRLASDRVREKKTNKRQMDVWSLILILSNLTGCPLVILIWSIYERLVVNFNPYRSNWLCRFSTLVIYLTELT